MKNKEKVNLDALRIDPEMKNNNTGGGKKKFIILIAMFTIIAGMSAVFLSKGGTEIEAVTVTVSQGKQDSAVLTASGYVEPRQKATVASKITGQIKELFVEEGMKVEKDQVLARLDDSEAKARYDSNIAEYNVAKAGIADLQVNLKNAQRILERRKKLYDKGWIGREEYDNALANVDSLKARLNLAKTQVKSAKARVQITKEDLDNCTIRAPFKGIAISKDAQVGEMVSPVSAGGGYTRTGISTIVDMTSLEIEVDVNESYIAKVKVGQEAIATLDSYPDWKIPAAVRTIIPTADRQKATVKVRITFKQLDPKILPDMGVKVYFMGQQKTVKTGPTILIPRKSTFKENNKTYVYLIKNQKIEKQAVSTGTTLNNRVTILAGLKAGDQLAADGKQKLKEGQSVEIKE